MDPQLDVNALIRVLAGAPEFVAFVQAQRAAGLSYNRAARNEFLAAGLGSQTDLDALERWYGIVLIGDVFETEINDAARRLEAAFRSDPLGRVLHLPDARILATAFLRSEAIATGDLHLFKRARDLGLATLFIGVGLAGRRVCPASCLGPWWSMNVTLTKDNLHAELLRDSVAGRLTEADALVWMLLLHTHRIELQPGVIPGLTVFPALTQRHAAAVIAALWAAIKDGHDERSEYVYWYWQYNKRTPYEVLDSVPDDLRRQLLEMRDALAQDPRVASVVPED